MPLARLHWPHLPGPARLGPAPVGADRGGAARDVPDAGGPSGLEVGDALAAQHVKRHRSLVVHDQPVAVDLLEAERSPDPHTARCRPVHQRATEPAEAVAERYIASDG